MFNLLINFLPIDQFSLLIFQSIDHLIFNFHFWFIILSSVKIWFHLISYFLSYSETFKYQHILSYPSGTAIIYFLNMWNPYGLSVLPHILHLLQLQITYYIFIITFNSLLFKSFNNAVIIIYLLYQHQLTKWLTFSIPQFN